MNRFIKYIFWAALFGWFLIGCKPDLDVASIYSTFTVEPPLSYTPSLGVTTTPTVFPLPDVTITPTLLPSFGSIIPVVEEVPDIPYGFAEKSNLFFREETILMASMGITAIHPATGITIKLEEDFGAQFLNSTGTSPLSPNGTLIAYVIDHRQLVLLDIATGDKRFFFFPGLIQSLAWMPDSDHMLLNVAAINEVGYTGPEQNLPDWLFYFNIETNIYTVLYDGFESNVEDVSSDGKSFLYYNNKYSEDLTMPVDIMLGFVSGDPPLQLTTDVLYKFWMDLTSDGQRIVVFAFDPNAPFDATAALPCHSSWNKAYQVDVRTRKIRDFPIAAKDAVEYIRLSPSGSKVAYVNAEGTVCAENFPIYILDLESGVEKRLDIRGFALGWSPDGSKLVFMQYSSEFQNYYRQLVIYDLLSHQVLATYYIEDIDRESATPYWVNFKDHNP